MSIFAGIEHKTGAGSRDPDPTPGGYVFEVKSIEDGVTQMSKDKFFAVSVKVVESSGEGSKTREGVDLEPLPVGTETRVFILEDRKYNYHVTDIKNVVSAISTSLLQENVKPSDVTEEDIKQLIESQGAKGVRFRATYSVKPGKFHKDGSPVCVMRFEGFLGDGAAPAPVSA